MTESTRPTKTEICCGGCEEQTGTKCGHCFEPIEVELTDAEVAQMEADRVAFEAQKAAEDQAKAEVEAAKASATAKLSALGLTDAEISALTK